MSKPAPLGLRTEFRHYLDRKGSWSDQLMGLAELEMEAQKLVSMAVL